MRSGIFAKALTLAVGFAAIAPAALADTIYDCTFEENRANNGWVPTQIVVSYDEGAETALVNDAMMMSAFGEPQFEAVRRNTEKRLVIEWEIGLKATDGTSAIFSYVLSIQKQSKTATINGFPEGYSNQFGAAGTCKVKTK